MKIIKYLILLFLFSPAFLYADFPVFEKASAMYRSLHTPLLTRKGHVGLYVNSDSLYEVKSGQSNLRNGILPDVVISTFAHGIIEASGQRPGDKGKVEFISFEEYLDGDTISGNYWGAYCICTFLEH